MTEANVALTRQLVDAYNGSDAEAAIALCSPDVVWVPQSTDVEGVYRGHEGVRRYFENIGAVWESIKFEVEEYHDLGDRLYALGVVRATSRGSQVELEQPGAALYEFRNGKAVRGATYVGPDPSLEKVDEHLSRGTNAEMHEDLA